MSEAQPVTLSEYLRTADMEKVRMMQALDDIRTLAEAWVTSEGQAVSVVAFMDWSDRHRSALSAADDFARLVQRDKEVAWQPIDTAPKGPIIRLKRVHEGEVVAEGDGNWGVLSPDAPYRKPIPPDGLGNPGFPPGDNADEPRWLNADGLHRFPEPTHWAPKEIAKP